MHQVAKQGLNDTNQLVWQGRSTDWQLKPWDRGIAPAAPLGIVPCSVGHAQLFLGCSVEGWKWLSFGVLVSPLWSRTIAFRDDS